MTNEIKLIQNKNGIQINFPKGTFKKNYCLQGCVRDNSICLSYLSRGKKNLTIQDQDTQQFHISSFGKTHAGGGKNFLLPPIQFKKPMKRRLNK